MACPSAGATTCTSRSTRTAKHQKQQQQQLLLFSLWRSVQAARWRESRRSRPGHPAGMRTKAAAISTRGVILNAAAADSGDADENDEEEAKAGNEPGLLFAPPPISPSSDCASTVLGRSACVAASPAALPGCTAEGDLMESWWAAVAADCG